MELFAYEPLLTTDGTKPVPGSVVGFYDDTDEDFTTPLEVFTLEGESLGFSPVADESGYINHAGGYMLPVQYGKSKSGDLPAVPVFSVRSVIEDAKSAVAAAAESRAAAVNASAKADQIPALVTQATTNSSTVVQAAAAATSAAVAEADIIRGEDARAAVPLEAGTGWAHPFTDGQGRIAGGFTDDGVFRLAQPLVQPADPFARRSSRTTVACIGDSLVYGYPAENMTWALELAKLNPGVEFRNSGQSGATCDEIRFRVGDLPLYCELPGGLIPASGSVSATVKQIIGFVPGRNNQYYGALAGINGTLATSDDGKTWTFTRAVAGTEKAVGGKQQLVRSVPDYSSDTVIIWMGRNDVSNNVIGREPDVVSHVIGSISELIDSLRPINKQFLVLPVLNWTIESAGTVKYQRIMEINRRLQEKYPSHFVDIRGYLVTQAIYDAQLTPTASDLDAMSKDAPPPQIMDGASHPLSFMVPHIARKINEHLDAKGYL